MKLNKNIFQVCINLNDDFDELLDSRCILLDRNKDWEYILISSEFELNKFMETHFRDSNDLFEQKIYECFINVRDLIDGVSKDVNLENDKDRFNKLVDITKLVAQIDVFRLAAIYKFGGLYFDISRQINLDLDAEFDNFDACFFRSDDEVFNGIFYAKQKM